MAGPIAAATSWRLSGPRLFERVAAIPFLASALAKAWPILPAPMIPMLGMLERGRDLLVKIFTPAAINGVKMRIYSGQISWYLIV
jgi:hypothetical protein